MSTPAAELTAIQMGLDEILCHFQDLEDPRTDINIHHDLETVIVISIMGILAGASGPTSIADWAKSRVELLSGLMPLPYGVPKKDVFRRILSALKPDAFQQCFKNWLTSIYDRAEGEPGKIRPIFAIDGKTLRRSHDRKNGLGALHSVSVWASDYGITLAQVATTEKSNEITAIPEVLKLINIEGAIITIDAIGTQREIVRQIIDGGGDYVVPVKGNQGQLHKGVMEYIDKQLEDDFKSAKARRFETEETGHGRVEKRLYVQMPVPKTLPGLDRWAGLVTIGVAMLTCFRDGKETYDVRYYISSLKMGVKQFARSVRSHWGIENSSHWTLDMTYREDESRVRGINIRENLAWLNRFTLSLLKQHKNKKSVRRNRQMCGWDDEVMLQILTAETT